MCIRDRMNTRFQKDEAIIAGGAAVDLVRASVNLVLAGLLIALGTSLKLPLSTTYVTFIGSSWILPMYFTNFQVKIRRVSFTAHPSYILQRYSEFFHSDSADH